MASFSLGVDIGGTFTDIILLDHELGRSLNHKELTTPDDPVQGVMRGINFVVERDGIDLTKIDRVVHATTLFTNAVIERRGAKTGLLVTAGFRDILEMRRESKYELYDINIDMPKPLVPRSLCLEVEERCGPGGEEVTPLNLDELHARVDELVNAGAESIAIVFLHAYANPLHEREAAVAIATRYPNIFVSTSHEVSPVIREYERASSTVANAYIQPLASRYLERLASEIAEFGIEAELFLMLSNGGLTHVSEARRVPVELLESGPAAGALAAAFFSKKIGINNVLAFDMGGTTAKLAVVENGEPVVAYEFEAAREKRFMNGSGLPIKISTIELIEIGAGGGSIASLDDLGLLKVGPRSASAVPGPACYGRGGEDATVTDANLHLGYLDPEYFAGGSIPIDVKAADKALLGLAKKLGLSITEVAAGIHDVVNENMASAARVHVAERGRDARNHALLVTGGGGPLHGTALAQKLGISTIICPPAAGVASAFGLLMAPARVDRVTTVAKRLAEIDFQELEASFRRLENDAMEVISDTGVARDFAVIERLADVRYVGQGFEIVVALQPGPLCRDARQMILSSFEKAYLEIFSQTLDAVPVEVMNIRVTARAKQSSDEFKVAEWKGIKKKVKPRGERAVYQPSLGEFVQTPVYARSEMTPGSTIVGPAVIEEPESSLLIGPGASVNVDAELNLVVKVDEVKRVESRRDFDAITLEVLWRRLITAVDEASAALVRSAFSTVLRESDDFSCVLTDANGRSLAQATKSIPAFIGTLPATVKHFLKHFGVDGLHPGDVLITNDPWMGTGHLFDINVAKPVFFRDKLVGFAASTAHAADIGGGQDAHAVKDVFEEGLALPMLKLYDQGRIDKNILSLIRANVRVPDQVAGDLFAQVNGLNLMEARLVTIMEEFSLDNLEALSEEICGRTERAMREAIRSLPNGVYRYAFDTDGGREPIHIKIAVSIKDDEIEVDFDGSSPQVSSAINVPYPYTFAFTSYGVRCIAGADTPNNEGSFAPITVRAPVGSVLNNVFPSSGGQRVCTGHYLPVAVFAALGNVIPDKVMAGAGSPLWSFVQTGVRDGAPYANKVFINGGMGATALKDGHNVLSWPSNVSSTPVEMLEQQAPLRLHYKRFRAGAGGGGQHRGGTGQELLFECLSEVPVKFTFNADRTRNAAPGLAGGDAGKCGEIRLNDVWHDSRDQLSMVLGDKLLIRTPSGGGFGHVEERDPALLEFDEREGYVTDAGS